MTSSLKFQCVLFLLLVSSMSIIAHAGNSLSDLSHLVQSSNLQAVTCAVPQNQCASQCTRRCSATSHKKPCLFYCNKCCNVCLCVPPGTYGSKECCPCYNNWKTKRGGPKCP